MERMREVKIEPKLNGQQKAEIFEKATKGARTCDLMEEYGVSRTTIQKIKYDPKRLEKAEKRLNAHQRFARIRIHDGAMKGVEKEHEILGMKIPEGEKDNGLLYLQHQVATSFMDRDGLKAPDKSEQRLEISFSDGLVDVGMPGENAEDTESGEAL